MISKKIKALIPHTVIQNKILFLRGKKVMLDRDLADLYGVETKHLTRQVRRNRSRFPADFLLVLTFCKMDGALRGQVVIPDLSPKANARRMSILQKVS